MFATFKLTARGNMIPAVIIMQLVMPLLFIFLITELFSGGAKYNGYMNIVLPGIILLNTSRIGIFNLTVFLSEWKSSILIKRIGITPITKSEFMVGTVLYFVVFSFLVAAWSFLVGVLFYHSYLQFSGISWPGVLISFLLSTIFSSLCGIFATGVARSQQTANMIAIFIWLPAAFLSGQIAPINVVENSSSLNLISHIFPQRYFNEMMFNAFAHNVSTGGAQPPAWYEAKDMFAGSIFIIPLAYIAGLSLLTVKTFKWTH